jgi:hypothetical protein
MNPELFYYAKGVVALGATLLLITHMSRSWGTISTLGQRLRYMTLFYLATLITVRSVDQAHSHASITWSPIAALIGALLLVVTSFVSIREDSPRR